MRGEDLTCRKARLTMNGSPPHARGRPTCSYAFLSDGRITPACAGKTTTWRRTPTKSPDHPRMRGEDVQSGRGPRGWNGSPPHARGRRRQTRRGVPIGLDHPRMRGEDTEKRTGPKRSAGSPPHARGRHGKTYGAKKKCRITPACAGKTSVEDAIEGMFEDHPRMRGEDMRKPYTMALRRGSPPHARGRHVTIQHVLLGRRITPACAGKTSL